MTGAPATPGDENSCEEYDHGWWKRAAGIIKWCTFCPVRETGQADVKNPRMEHSCRGRRYTPMFRLTGPVAPVIAFLTRAVLLRASLQP